MSHGVAQHLAEMQEGLATHHQKKKRVRKTHILVAAATLLVGVMALTPLFSYRNLTGDDTTTTSKSSRSTPRQFGASDNAHVDVELSLRAMESLTSGLPLSHLRSLPPQQLAAIRGMLQGHLSSLAANIAKAAASDPLLKKAASSLHLNYGKGAAPDAGGPLVETGRRSSGSHSIVVDITQRRLMEFAETMMVPNNGWTRLRDPRGDTGMPKRVVVNHTSRTAIDDASRVEGTMQNMRCALQLMSRSAGAHLGGGQCTLDSPNHQTQAHYRFLPIARIRRHLKGCINALFASEAFVSEVVLRAASPIVDVCTLYDAMVLHTRPRGGSTRHQPRGSPATLTASSRSELKLQRAHAAQSTIALRSAIDMSCGQLRMLDVGIPESFFATTTRDWTAGGSTSANKEANGTQMTGGRFAADGDEVNTGSLNLEDDAEYAASKRLPWKPFDIAPIGRSLFHHVEQLQPLLASRPKGPRAPTDASSAEEGVRGTRAALREVMSVMERSFFVYIGTWESGLGDSWENGAPHAHGAARGRRHSTGNAGQPQQGWSVPYPRPSVQRSCRATVADHLLHQRYALEEFYGSDGAVLRAIPDQAASTPAPEATRQDEMHAAALGLGGIRRKPARRKSIVSLFDERAPSSVREVTLADAARLAYRTQMNASSGALRLPSVAWVTSPDTVPVNSLDLRVPLVIAAGALPLFNPVAGIVDGVPLELHEKCDKCFPSAPREGLVRAQRLAGVSFTKKQSTAADREHGVPLIDWMRFQPQEYAMVQTALFTHARQHMTTRAMALNVLRFSVPHAMRVVLVASDPLLPAIHALAHGLCDVGVAEITMHVGVGEAIERDALLQAIYWRAPHETPCAMRYVTEDVMLSEAAPRAELLVAIADDAKDGASPEAFQHRLNVLRSASHLNGTNQVVVVYNGRAHRRVGGMSAWCDWAMCNATMFRTRRVGAPQMPVVSTLQLSVDGRTYKIKSDMGVADGYRSSTRSSGPGPCPLTSPYAALQPTPTKREVRMMRRANPLRSNANPVGGDALEGRPTLSPGATSAATPVVAFELNCLKNHFAKITARVLQEWFAQFPDAPEGGWNYSSFQLSRPRNCHDIEVQLAVDDSDVVDACTKSKVLGVTKFEDFSFNISGPVTMRARAVRLIRERTGCRLRWEKHQPAITEPPGQQTPEVTTMILRDCPTYLAALTGKKMLLRVMKSARPPAVDRRFD